MSVALALFLVLPVAGFGLRPSVAQAQDAGGSDPATTTGTSPDQTGAPPTETPPADQNETPPGGQPPADTPPTGPTETPPDGAPPDQTLPGADATAPTGAPPGNEPPGEQATPPSDGSSTEPPPPDPGTVPATEENTPPAEGAATAPATPADAPTPTGTPAPKPSATPTATPTSTAPVIQAAETRPSQVLVTLNCRSNPEQTRIDNTGDTQIKIISLASLSGNGPITVNRLLGAGRTLIYRSGSGATTGTILTTNSFYVDDLWDLDGVVIQTSAGEVSARCPADPDPPVGHTPPPGPQITVTVSCNHRPELTRVDNNGDAAVTIIRVAPIYSGAAPVVMNRKLGPGKTVIFRSGPSVTTGTVIANYFLYDDLAFENEGALVTIAGGQTFVDRCDPSPISIPTPTPIPGFPGSNPATKDPTPNLSVALHCNSNPEKTRITNTGTGWVTITSIGSLYDSGPAEPFAVLRTLQPGDSVTFQSGAGATSNVLTLHYIYTNTAGPRDGVRITTSVGTVVTARCA